MVRTDLTKEMISEGRILTDRLDSEFSVKSSLWFFDSDAALWHLVIALKEFPEMGPSAIYKKVRSIIEQYNDQIPNLTLEDISLVHPDSRMIADLRSLFKKEGTGRIRISRTTMNGRSIEDVLIYRLGR